MPYGLEALRYEFDRRRNMNARTRSLISLFVALVLLIGTISLAGCSGSKNDQDNCYGEDMPVVNN